MLGVTVGVMALIIALALMTGLQRELRDRILGSNPHIYVWKTGGIERLPRPRSRSCASSRTSSAPRRRCSGKALVIVGGDEAFISIKGIDPTLEQR